MAEPQNIVVDTAETQAAIRALGPKAEKALLKALRAEAEIILTDAKENYVPVATGTLRRSGFVQAEDDGVVIGFGGPSAPYALAVHENPRAGQTGGASPQGQTYKRWSRVGQWKYLETPALKRAPQIPDAVAKRLEAEIR